MTRALRVCFHAPLLWPLWSDGRVAFTGGAEVQQARLARGLAARGVEMTVVSCDYGQPSPVTAHGVRVLKSYRLGDGLPVLRFFHPRLSRTMAALLAADADVYYVRGASLEAGTAYEAARLKGRAFVFGAAHDHDALASLPLLGNPRDRAWYRRALRGARAVVAQTDAQRDSFRREFAVESTVVRNLVEVPEHSADAAANAAVVWLATYKASKRPDWFLDLARALPERRFVMCGIVPIPPETTTWWERAESAARELPNLEVRGYLDQERVGELYRSAGLFVHTSPAEGFPNTVLEAWAHGVPTVSCVDPDGVVAREGLGEVVADPAALAAAVERWMSAPARRAEAGGRARAYALRAHAPEAVLAQLEDVFRRAAGR
ncbi:MAG: glycosyltransferase family 4 protein [Candidatus Eisenbacteria bacterium]|uniref:Glycosyltransferase family 4 protein n=1 Tax=Eiseniibacteriota bacterium TaxID=2212470 RepID=A0A933SG48_UNCEI|nr:glycosyltransferase family 4 protein [Candidatus Eisenbacteria bacterium]